MDAATLTRLREQLDAIQSDGAAVLRNATLAQETLATVVPDPEPIGFGICIHSNFLKSVYKDYDKVFDCVMATGATFVRDLLVPDPKHPQRALFRRFRDAGVGVHATIGRYGETNDKTKLLAAMVDVADCLVEVSGWNEPDKAGFVGWIIPTIAWQRWLSDTVKSTPELHHVAVCGPPLRDANKNLASDLEDLYEGIDIYYDLANIHCYPKGNPVADHLDTRIAMLPQGVPVVISEGGYSTNVGGKGFPVTEADQATLTVDYVTQANARGIRPYLYELLDDPDPTGADRESNLGLFRSDYSPKPVVAALAALSKE